jgi:hypothetical protein
LVKKWKLQSKPAGGPTPACAISAATQAVATTATAASSKKAAVATTAVAAFYATVADSTTATVTATIAAKPTAGAKKKQPQQ